jgi:predicted RNA-binding protein with TRAM domain
MFQSANYNWAIYSKEKHIASHSSLPRHRASQNRASQNRASQNRASQNRAIEDIGEQGDGITRVERGFVVIVPDTKASERVTVEITNVQQNVAFAEVVDRLSYYE